MTSQILPVSFAQNLFILAMLMKQPPKPTKKVLTHSLAIRLGPLTVFYVCLAIVPHIVNTRYLMPAVGVTRIFLVWPFLLATSFSDKATSYVPVLKAQENDGFVFIAMGVVALYYFCIHSMLTLAYNGFSFRGLITAINSDPAVSTLGYDYVLSLVSAFMWYKSVKPMDEKGRTTQPTMLIESRNLA